MYFLKKLWRCFNINKNELILKAKKGDNGAKEKILENFRNCIIKKAINYNIKNYDVDDIIQECNINILKAIETYNVEKNSFTTYILMTIQNTLNSLFRTTLPHYENETYSDRIEYMVGENIENILDKISFDEITKDLKENEKIVIIYFYVYNLKLSDIAKILNLSRDKCKNIKRNAMKKLKEKFRFRYDSFKYCFK